MKRQHSRWALLAGLAGLAACDQQRSTTQPPLVAAAQHAPLTRAAISAVEADRRLIRTVTRDAVRDGIKNANVWFGDRKRRNPYTTCRGMERLIAKHMAKFDEGKSRSRTNEQRLAAAGDVVRGLGCGKPAAMTLFGKPMAPAAAPAAAIPDSVDEWLNANWRQGSWSDMISAHAEAEGGSISPFVSGMTEFEISLFESVRCSQDDVVAGIAAGEGGGEGGGEDPMMMFYAPPWMKAVLRGCAANVITNIPAVVTGAKLGFALWGPWGAAAGAAGNVLEACIFGGIAGYILWEQ